MFDEPKLSPWGAVQYCEEMNDGIYFVETAEHSGIMVKVEYAVEIFSPEARKCGFREKGYLNFDEDFAAAVAQREFLDKEIWDIPNYVNDKAEYENSLNSFIKQYFFKYWEEREKRLPANTYDKRYVVHDFSVKGPVMIDTCSKTLKFYSYNVNGEIYDLKKPETHIVTAREISGLVRRTQDYFNYYRKTGRTVDSYIYKYLMTKSQQEQCGVKPEIFLSKKITETNDFKEAVRKMCEWCYENNHHLSDSIKENDREKNLQYCEDYLKDIRVEINYLKNKAKESLLQTLREKNLKKE